jgi:hypothetical protein
MFFNNLGFLMRGQAVRAKSVLWCSHCRIPRYVAAPLRSVSKYDVISSDMVSSIHSHHGFHGSFQAPHRYTDQARAQVSLKIYDITSSGMWCTAITHSPWISWVPLGSLPPSGPGERAQVSLKIWCHKLRYDVSDNTLTMDFMGAFRLFAAIRTKPGLRSVSKYDFTSSDMTSSIHPHCGLL